MPAVRRASKDLRRLTHFANIPHEGDERAEAEINLVYGADQVCAAHGRGSVKCPIGVLH